MNKTRSVSVFFISRLSIHVRDHRFSTWDVSDSINHKVGIRSLDGSRGHNVDHVEVAGIVEVAPQGVALDLGRGLSNAAQFVEVGTSHRRIVGEQPHLEPLLQRAFLSAEPEFIPPLLDLPLVLPTRRRRVRPLEQAQADADEEVVEPGPFCLIFFPLSLQVDSGDDGQGQQGHG